MVRQIEEQAGHRLGDPAEAIRVVSGKLRYTEAQQADILAHFITGGTVSAAGIMHAVTSVAQTQPAGDAAHQLESTAMQALSIAASL